MDFKEIAEHMYPFWILGVVILGMVLASGHKYLLRAEKRPIAKWIILLCWITLYRVLMSKLLNFQGISSSPSLVAFFPIATVFTVFWEDAVHGLPLLIFKKLTKGYKWVKPIYYLLLVMVMVEFGLGHVYQGPLAAFCLSFYIPYTVKMGEKYGFGTVMLCHMMYDFVTLMYAKHMIGL